jgi:hypothetical protein
MSTDFLQNDLEQNDFSLWFLRSFVANPLVQMSRLESLLHIM